MLIHHVVFCLQLRPHSAAVLLKLSQSQPDQCLESCELLGAFWMKNGTKALINSSSASGTLRCAHGTPLLMDFLSVQFDEG